MLMDIEKLNNLKAENIVVMTEDTQEKGPRHFHLYWELKLYKFIDDSMQLFFIAPKVVHSPIVLESTEDEIVVQFSQPEIKVFVKKNSSKNRVAKEFFLPLKEVEQRCPGGSLSVFSAIMQAKNGDEPNLLVALSQLLLTVIYAVFDNIEKYSERKPVVTQVSVACYYIEQNYHQPELSVEQVARMLNITAGYLVGLFKEAGLPTVRQYIIKTRLQHALQLFKNGKYSVKEVTVMTGWSCPFYFSNSFKKYFGISPSQVVCQRQIPESS